MKYLIGIQPTGKLHLGNYLGCIKRGLELQNEGHLVTFLIANYHSLTTDSYSKITEQELIKLGCKNIKKQTPEYTELFFKLCCKMSLSSLLKMPQYKDKKEQTPNDLGLLLYPVLMCADIMMNNPDFVIVGKDQVAHMDLCNDLVKKVDLPPFKYELGEVDKVMSLTEPDKKMSKSGTPKSILYLFEENYRAKLRKANSNPEGLQNLITIGKSLNVNIKDYENTFIFKMALAEKLESMFNI